MHDEVPVAWTFLSGTSLDSVALFYDDRANV